MRVCSQCLQGLSPNLSQYHTWSIWNWWFEKKIKIQNGIWLKELICKSMYRKLKWFASAAIEIILARNRAINLVGKNLIESEMFPTWTKKTEALTWGAQFPEHRHWKQGKIPNLTSLVWLHHTNVTKEHKSLNVSYQWRYPYQNLSLIKVKIIWRYSYP